MNGIKKVTEKAKDKLQKIFEGEYRGIAILFILQFILFITIRPIRYDDEFYIEALTGSTIIDFITNRYYTWTSRIVIEGTLGIIFKGSRYIWIFGTIAFMTLIGYSILRLFVKKENRKELSMMVLWLVVLYPLERLSSAGWAATTVNYLWPLALGLFSLISIRKIYDNEKVGLVPGILYLLATVYACNQEQMCAILVVTYILFTIIFTIRDKKKVNLFMYLQTLLAIASFIFIMTTPGNALRQVEEIVTDYPDFFRYSIIEKIVLGINTTMGEMIANYTMTFTIFTLIMLIFVWSNYKDRLVRGISAVPFTASIVLGIGSPIMQNVSILISWIKERYSQAIPLIAPINYSYLGSYVEFILALVVIACIMLTLLLIFKKLKNNIAFYVFGYGLVTRIVMGFSPTIFVSRNRTCVFFEFACLICTLLIWQEFIKKAEKKNKTRVYNIVAWSSIVQYVITLAFIFISHINV